VEKLKKNWNAVVTPRDTVILPGDISWAMTLSEATDDFRFLDELNGTKIVGKGNHDFWWATMNKVQTFFAENHIESIKCLHNNAFAAENFVICGSRGWFNDQSLGGIPENTDYEKIINREVMRLKLSLEMGKNYPKELERLVFLHFPPLFKDFRCEEIIAVLKEYGIKRCYYGHIHGCYDQPSSFSDNGITYPLISADHLNFTPKIIIPE
jgi:predicted phosphohydrolase